jgi:hypothetical protein
MLTRALKLCSQVAVALAISAVPASAVSIGPGGDNPITQSDTFLVSPSVNPAGAGLFSNFFNFTAMTNTAFFVRRASVIEPGGDAGEGIANLVMSVWTSHNGGGSQIGGNIQVTDPNGAYTGIFSPSNTLAPALLLSTFLPANPFSVKFEGSRLFAGGSYSAQFLAQTPLPPALLLFGTALAGMGFLGRRRRKSSSPA